MLRRLDSFVCIVAICSSSCGSGSTPASPSSSTTAAPTVTAIVPANGSTQGGTTVTITGTHLAAGAVVTIGGDPAGNVQVVDAGHITARTSPHAAGVADVAVRVAATAGTLPGAFIGPFHFIVPPILFGWEDTNGNGVPEILDSAPY
jgi:hypothetical protein